MKDKVANLLMETVINTCKTFYLRSYNFNIENKIITIPSTEAFRQDAYTYCSWIKNYLCDSNIDITDTPLYNLYRIQLNQESMIPNLQEALEGINTDDILSTVCNDAILDSIKDFVRYSEVPTQIMVAHAELVKYTAYQFMASYLYHNSHIRLEIEPIKSISNKYYLTNDPTNILLMQNNIANSKIAFNRWLYDNCIHVMSVIDFVTTAKCDMPIITFDSRSGNVLYDIHFGMYVK